MTDTSTPVPGWVFVALTLLAGVVAVVTFAAVTGDAPESPDSGGEVATSRPSPSVAAPSPTGAPAETSSPPASERPAAANERGGLVIWARGDLEAGFADAVGALEPVVAAAHVRSSTLGLVRSWTADGSVSDDLAEGFRIPVEVAAVDPSRYAPTVPAGAGRDAIRGLESGQALLSETAARLRGIGAGGRIALATLGDIDVVGVVGDGVVGRAEIVLHEEDADAAGIDTDGTVFLRHDAAPGAQTDALIAEVEGLVPPDLIARIVDVAAGEPRRRAPLVLSLAQVKDRFGEFAFRPRDGTRDVDIDPAFRDAHIVTVDVPVLGAVTCHEDIVEDLRGALEQVVDDGLAAEIHPEDYAGCFYPRRISVDRDRLSHHSWGIALDINVDLDLPDLGPAPPPGVIAAFEAHGFRWGGDFLHPDNHHFEWVGEVTEPPAQTGG